MYQYLIPLFVSFFIFTGCNRAITNSTNQNTLSNPPKNVDALIENKNEATQNQNIAETVSAEKEFRDGTLAIAFNYPKEWGEVTIEKNEALTETGKSNGIDMELLYVALGNREVTFSAFRFLTADDPDVNSELGRGGFWGDTASRIDAKKGVTAYCESRENCTVFTNKNGIEIAMHKEDLPSVDDEAKVTTQYYIYNSSSPFSHIVLSTTEMEKAYEKSNVFAPEEAAAHLRNLVESFNFFFVEYN